MRTPTRTHTQPETRARSQSHGESARWLLPTGPARLETVVIDLMSASQKWSLSPVLRRILLIRRGERAGDADCYSSTFCASDDAKFGGKSVNIYYSVEKNAFRGDQQLPNYAQSRSRCASNRVEVFTRFRFYLCCCLSLKLRRRECFPHNAETERGRRAPKEKVVYRHFEMTCKINWPNEMFHKHNGCSIEPLSVQLARCHSGSQFRPRQQ